VRLARRAAEPRGEQPRRISRRDTLIEQVGGGVDPLGEHVTASAATASRPTIRHVTNVLLNMSRTRGDTPRPLAPAVAQRHLETEVANCVGGVFSPLLANIYLQVLDEAMDRAG